MENALAIRILPRVFDSKTEAAIRASLAAHAGQTRRSDGAVPYVSHPFHVALILARLGAESRVIQAALLHDVVEDCDEWTIERVEREFGPDVARTVAELTEDKSRTWPERKRAQIDHVAHSSPDAVAVKAADKLHNLRTLTEDLRNAADSNAVWEKFRGGRERTLAFARELVEVLAARCDPRLAAELRAALQDFERASG